MTRPEVVVLVSCGRHPVSGRPRRPPGDARAVELGLRLAGPHGLQIVHAGDPDDPALRDYLGMGLPELQVLETPAAADVAPVLGHWLLQAAAGLVLTGNRAECGPGSGCLPYSLARHTGAVIADGVVALTPEADGYRLIQALPGGRRRALRAAAPLLAVVSPAAPAPRPVAFGPARRGRIRVRAPAVAAPPEPVVTRRPARQGPRRLRVLRGLSAEERMRAASGGGNDRHGRLYSGMSAAEAARLIHQQLIAWGVLDATTAPPRQQAEKI